MRIEPYSGIGDILILPPTPGTGRAIDFQAMIRNSVGEVNRSQAEAERLMEMVASGQEVNREVVNSAVAQADLAFRTLIQIRAKLTDAFQELRQLQI